MSGGGKKEQGGGGFSYDTGKANPFDPKDFTKQLGGDFKEAYEQGPHVFDKSLYAGMGGGTKGNVQNIIEMANRPAPQFGKAMDFASGAIDQAGQPGLASQNLNELASGNMIGASNPYREQILDRTRADVESRLGASGRFGTDDHVEELTDSLGALRGSFYDQDRAQQMNAINMINNEKGQQFGQGMSASSALPSFYQNQFMPQTTALGANQMLDQERQKQLMAEYDLFDRKNPFNHVLNTASGLQGLQGTPAMQQEKKSNPFLDVLGFGMQAVPFFL